MVVDDGAVTARQYGGHLHRKRQRNGVAYQVHASVKRVETRLAKAMVDRPPVHPGGKQLRSPDDPVLRRRDRRDRLVGGFAYLQIAHS